MRLQAFCCRARHAAILRAHFHACERMFDRPAAIRARLKAPALLVAAILLAWFAFEAMLYRSGAYFRIAEPDSNTGAVVSALMAVEQQHRPDARNILVFGDSRVAEGFSSPRAAGGDPGFNFINAAVPGSTPRTWFYLLREIDRRGLRFEAIVIGTLYRDRDTGLRADWPLDPAHAATLLGLADAIPFPATFESADMQARARQTVLFPALAMRQDTLALLQAPRQRRDRIREVRPGFLASVRNYPGNDATMPSLRFASGGHAVSDWGDATPQQRVQIEAHLSELGSRPDAVIAANDAFLERWLRAMAQVARDRKARVIVYPLPRGPYRDALGDELPLPPSLQALQRTPGITVLPPDRLARLESPDYFFDTLHANRAGREYTSESIGTSVRVLLADAPP